jgi:hypothetical protein
VTSAPGDPRSTAQWRRIRKQVIALSTTCAICQLPLYPDAKPRTRWSTSVDHVRPLRMGGDPYDRANLRAVHLGCNVRSENTSRRSGRGKHGGARGGAKVPRRWSSGRW